MVAASGGDAGAWGAAMTVRARKAVMKAVMNCILIDLFD